MKLGGEAAQDVGRGHTRNFRGRSVYLKSNAYAVPRTRLDVLEAELLWRTSPDSRPAAASIPHTRCVLTRPGSRDNVRATRVQEKNAAGMGHVRRRPPGCSLCAQPWPPPVHPGARWLRPWRRRGGRRRLRLRCRCLGGGGWADPTRPPPPSSSRWLWLGPGSDARAGVHPIGGGGPHLCRRRRQMGAPRRQTATRLHSMLQAVWIGLRTQRRHRGHECALRAEGVLTRRSRLEVRLGARGGRVGWEAAAVMR